MDVQVLETGNGGDMQIQGNDLVAVFGVENMPYLGTFGGDANWWGNDLLFSDNDSFKFTSETEALLIQLPLTSANRLLIEAAIKRDLQFLLDNVPDTTLTVQTQIQSDNTLLMNVDFGGYQFSLLWNPSAQAAKKVPYTPPSLVVWTEPTAGYPYAITEGAMVFGGSTAVLPCAIFDNSTDVTNWITYLNTTFRLANGLRGSFAYSDGRVIYNQGSAENWRLSQAQLTLTDYYTLELKVGTPSGSPSDYQFNISGALSYSVVDWGDSSAAIQYQPPSATSITASHTYADAMSGRTARVFHGNTLFVALVFSYSSPQYSLYILSGDLPTSLKTLVIVSQNVFNPFTTIMPVSIETLTLGLNDINDFVGTFNNPMPNIRIISAVNNKLGSSQVDNIFNDLVANTPNTIVYSPAIRQITTLGQTPSAPPTGASLLARTSLTAAGWTILTD